MPDPETPPDILESFANEILAKFRRLDQILIHAPSRGTYHENVIRQFLRDYLPNTFSVGEGFVSNFDGGISPQTDVLVVDNLDPRSFAYKDAGFFIASEIAVTTIGEIKTKPTKREFIEAFIKLIKTSQVSTNPARMTSFLLCYDIGTTATTFQSWLDEATRKALEIENIQAPNFPDYIFCIKKGILQYRETSDQGIQYFTQFSNRSDSTFVKRKIISSLIQVVVNGGGRLRQTQGLRLHE